MMLSKRDHAKEPSQPSLEKKATSSAPGKLLFTGEYAVLDGYVAVVAAVTRRAHATFSTKVVDSELLGAALPYLKDEHAQRLSKIRVDSSELFCNEQKVGLGSSAAAMVSALALAIGRTTAHPNELFAIAHRAHGDFQGKRGARGSGIDVAASVFGGVFAARIGDANPVETQPLRLPKDLFWVPVWTGVSAPTGPIVAEIRAQRRHPASQQAIAQIATASRAFVVALEKRSAKAALNAIKTAGDALVHLSEATGTELVTETHRKIRALAALRGGAAKPTGAGGGDMALAAFATREAAQHFRKDLQRIDLQALEFGFDPRGACLLYP